MRTKKHKKVSSGGVALLLVMTVVAVVLSTMAIGVTLLLNNLDESKGRESAEQALASAQAGIEKTKGYYKELNEDFFGGCTVNDCIDFTNHRCIACGDSGSIYNEGNRSYQVKITNLNANGVALLSTGYNGSYRQAVRDAVTFVDFICGDPVKGVVRDQDNFEYPTVQIGDQCWFAESLKTRRKQDGTCVNNEPEFSPPTCIASGNYGGAKESNRDCMHSTGVMMRGKENDCEGGYTLYRWEGAMNEDPGNTQGICPNGWHIPTIADQDELINSGVTGEDLQIGGSSGFNAILAGDRELDGDTFAYRDEWDCFWTSAEYDKDNAHYFCVQSKQKDIFTFADNKNYNIGVRCIKDS